MYRFKGWRFLSLGRSLERILLKLQYLEVLLSQNAPEGAMELAIELGDSQMVLHSRYWGIANSSSVVDLLVDDVKNPRSIRFNFLKLQELLLEIPKIKNSEINAEMDRTLKDCRTILNSRKRSGFNDFPFSDLSNTLRIFSDQLSSAYFH